MKRTLIVASLFFASLAHALMLPDSMKANCGPFQIRPNDRNAFKKDVKDNTLEALPIRTGGMALGTTIGVALWPVGLAVGLPLATIALFSPGTYASDSMAGLVVLPPLLLPFFLGAGGWELGPEDHIYALKLKFIDSKGRLVCKMSYTDKDDDDFRQRYFLRDLASELRTAKKQGLCMNYADRNFEAARCAP